MCPKFHENPLPVQIQRDPLRNPDTTSLHGSAQAMLESVLGRNVVRGRSVTKERLLGTRNGVTR